MKKLISLILLFCAFKVSAQTYTLNYDSVRVGKTPNSSVLIPKDIYLKGLPKGLLSIRTDGKVIHNDTVYISQNVFNTTIGTRTQDSITKKLNRSDSALYTTRLRWNTTIPTVITNHFVPYTGAIDNITLGNHFINLSDGTNETQLGVGSVEIITAAGNFSIRNSSNANVFSGFQPGNFYTHNSTDGYTYFDNSHIQREVSAGAISYSYSYPNATGTFALAERVLALTGGILTGPLTLSGDGTAALHPVSYGQFLNWNNGLAWKHSVIASTTSPLPTYTVSGDFQTLTATANGAFPVTDGVTLVLNDRILVKNEAGANRTNHGGFKLTQVGNSGLPWILTRMEDSDSSARLVSATYKIREGSTQAFQTYSVNVDPIVLGTTEITFALTGGPGTYMNGTGINLSGNIFSFDTTFGDSRYKFTTVAGYGITDAITTAGGQTIAGGLGINGNLSLYGAVSMYNTALALFGSNLITSPSIYITSGGIKIGTTGNLSNNYTEYGDRIVKIDDGSTLHYITIPTPSTITDEFALLSQIPTSTNFIPYSGAPSNVNLNGKNLTNVGLLSNSGQSGFGLSPTGTSAKVLITDLSAVQSASSTYKLQVSGVGPRMMLDNYAPNPSAAGNEFAFRTARGTSSAPSQIKSGDALFFITSQGYEASGYTGYTIQAIGSAATQDFTSGAVGRDLSLSTTPNGTANSSLRLYISQDGVVTVGGNTKVGSLGVNLSTATTTPRAVIDIGTNSGFSTANSFSSGAVGFRQDALTYTSTAAASTNSTAIVNIFAIPVLASTNSGNIITDAYTAYIAGVPVPGSNTTITNRYSLGVVGTSQFDGTILPKTNLTWDLGSSTFKWNSVYGNVFNASVVNTDALKAAGSVITFQSAAGTAWGRFFSDGRLLLQTGGTFANNATDLIQITGNILSGKAGTQSGGFYLEGATSGRIAILPQSAAGTYNFNLPITAGTAGQVLTSQGGGSSAMTWTTPSGSGTVTSVSGTTNRVTVATGTTTPVIDISSSYVGQSSITTLGTIATGVWQGTAIADTYISSAATWNAKQASLSGSGIVKSTSGTISYITDNSSNWNTAYSERNQWDGGSTGLNASTGRASLGLGSLATQNGTFSGTSSGTNTGDQTNISGNAGTVTNGVYTTTFNGLGDARYVLLNGNNSLTGNNVNNGLFTVNKNLDGFTLPLNTSAAGRTHFGNNKSGSQGEINIINEIGSGGTAIGGLEVGQTQPGGTYEALLNINGTTKDVTIFGKLVSTTLPTYSSGGASTVVWNNTTGVFESGGTAPIYTEGTWTPVPSPGGTALAGTYTKVGNLVRAHFSVSISSSASGSSFNISGLPFANSSKIGSVIISGTDVGTPITGYVPGSTSQIQFKDFTNTDITNLQFSSKIIYGTAIYSTTN